LNRKIVNQNARSGFATGEPATRNQARAQATGRRTTKHIMSISKRKLQANRTNAHKSTGPRTTAGRETVSHNRTTHGLCGRFRVLPSEDQAEYDDLLERFMQAEQPADDVERELVAKMARHTWLSERALRFQEACFLFQPPTQEQQASERQSCGVLKDIDVYIRYQAAHDRAYQRAAGELAKRRKDSLLAERGFESQKRAQAEAERREQRQNQHDELHLYKVAAAKMRLEHQMDRSFKANSAIQAPTQPSPDANSHKTAA
jgi:hypothetical protein